MPTSEQRMWPWEGPGSRGPWGGLASQSTSDRLPRVAPLTPSPAGDLRLHPEQEGLSDALGAHVHLQKSHLQVMASLPVPLNLSGGEVALGNVQELKNQNIFDFSPAV